MITVWLKVRRRHPSNDDIVYKSLNFWLGVFSDSKKYDIYIYSEDLNLPPEYSTYKIIRKEQLLNNVKCKKIFNKIQTCSIDPKWKGAAFALSAPYFYTNGELIYNIDSDDMLWFGPAKKYLNQLEKEFENPEIFTMSHDLHYSYHQGNYFHFRPHHWCLGINLSRRQKMEEMILKVLYKQIPPPPWGLNLDYAIDVNIETSNSPHFCFVSPSLLMHYWIINHHLTEDYKGVKFDQERNLIESSIFGKTEFKEKHRKTLLLK